MHNKKESKMYVVRKYIMADSVASALKLEKKIDVHEVYVDDEWRKNQKDKLADAIGFYAIPANDSDETS